MANKRKRIRKQPFMKCRACSTRFRRVRRGQIYCCAACRQSAHRQRQSELIYTALTGGTGLLMIKLREDLRRIMPQVEATTILEGQKGGIFGSRATRQLNAVERILERGKVRKELRKAGIDPRPARRNGRAVR